MRPVCAVAALIMALCITIAWAAPGLAGQPAEVRGPAYDPTALDVSSVIDASNIRMFVSNLGVFARDWSATGPGLEFPIGSGKSLTFSAGIWVGARVGGDLRLAIGGYTPEFSPGPIDETGQYADPSDPRHKVYKIERGDTTSADYLNWPSDLGAPVDAYGRPLSIGDQTLWCVYNDGNPDRHVALEGSTAPLGIEVQQTAYAFDRGPSLGNTVFMEFKVINELTDTLDSTYVSIWCDVDVGNYADDLAGCDTVLAVGFGYNWSARDDIYGTRPPCIGVDLLRGPTGDGGSDLGMTSFRKYGSGFDPTTPEQVYNMMKGLQLDGSPVVDPISGNPTTYQVPGDPAAGTGWLDMAVTDKRFMLSAGPFTLEPGDVKHIAIAIIAARGRDRLNSVQLLKVFDHIAQNFYDNGLDIQVMPAFDAIMADGGNLLTWTNPDRPGFAEMAIRYSTEAFPAGMEEGLPVPNGCDGRFPGSPGALTTFLHTGVAPAVTYYYAAFARYSDLGYSLVGLADATWDGGGSAGIGPILDASEMRLGATPAPAYGQCVIEYAMASPGPVKLVVYNTSGQAVRMLVDEVLPAGHHRAVWDGHDDRGASLPPGVYFASLRLVEGTRTCKIVVAR